MDLVQDVEAYLLDDLAKLPLARELLVAFRGGEDDVSFSHEQEVGLQDASEHLDVEADLGAQSVFPIVEAEEAEAKIGSDVDDLVKGVALDLFENGKFCTCDDV